MKFRILVLLSVLLPFLVSAEEKQSAFRSLNADDGLTHNAVLAILQDRMGFMWFGTKDGLNRYDGTEIQTAGRVFGISCVFLLEDIVF